MTPTSTSPSSLYLRAPHDGHAVPRTTMPQPHVLDGISSAGSGPPKSGSRIPQRAHTRSPGIASVRQ